MSKHCFCHLHTHTQYSLLDGASRLTDVLERARAMGQTALAITDHGNMFGAVEFYQTARDLNEKAAEKGLPAVKPIIGMEAYIVPGGERREKREKIDGEYDHHCLLWASDYEGYKNLMKLSSLAYAEGFYMHPRLDMDSLAQYSKGLIASSGCLASEVPYTIMRKDYAAAQKVAGRYIEIFGKNNFYFEVQDQAKLIAKQNPHNEDAAELARLQKQVNESVIKLSKELGCKLIATNDSHYTTREDAEAHDALLCIGTGKLIADPNRMRFACSEFYLKSEEEMLQLFGDLPEALKNTAEIAERCNLEIPFGEYHFPKFDVPGKGGKPGDPNEYFEKLVNEGLVKRYGKPLPKEVRARADEEMRVLKKMGFVQYLLIVADIVQEAFRRKIPVGPGRGSAAGSIVCYGLGITNLDPLRYQLLFERFVNEGRNEMPDIDIDFCQNRRPEIIEYVQDKYGRDHTAGIITFNTMAAKGAVRDLGRVMDWPLPEVDKIAKMIPGDPGKKITLQERTPDSAAIHVIDDDPDFKALYDSDGQVRKLIDMARRIEGLARNPGRHAAGLVVADKPVTEYCPLYRDKDGALLTQYEMSHIDAVGLLKIDFLGLQNLTILELALRYIKERHNQDIDIDKLPLVDQPTFDMLGRGEAKGVFQFESDGMIRMLVDARPDCLEDLIALNAMFRPGPLENIPSFVSRKHGREPIEYLVPQLEPILKETYGIIVYQEQVMQIANRLADFSLSEADSLRKAMGKKKKSLMEKYGVLFVKGCAKNGIPKDKSEPLYDLIAKFASYGFNKSHAAAYALVAYQTAYLKANFTPEYMAALLSLNQGSTEDVVLYIEESKRMGLEILGPDVNTSDVYFTIEGDKSLRFSMGAIKGVGEKAVEEIVAQRTAEGPFKDLYDFCERIDTKAVNKGCVESLIKAGAFDKLIDDGGRGRMIAAVEEALSHGASVRRDREAGQGNLFGDAAGTEDVRPQLPQVAGWDDKQTLEEEKKVLGFYFSGHPLDDVRELVEGLASTSIKGLGDITEGYEVVVGAYVNVVNPKQTRATGDKMAVLNIEDFSGAMEAVVFPRTYQKFKDLILPDRILFFRGKIRHGDGGTQNASIFPDEIMTLDDAVRKYMGAITLILRQEDGAFAGPLERVSGNGNGNGHASKPKKTKGKPASAGGLSARVESLIGHLRAHAGHVPVWFKFELVDGPGAPSTVDMKAGRKLAVSASPELFAGFRQLLPHGAVKVTGENNKPHRPAEPAWKRRSMAGVG